MEMFFDIFHGKSYGTEFPEDVQGAYIIDAVHAVAVCIAPRFENSGLLVISEGVRADIIKSGDLSDLVIFFHFIFLSGLI